MLLYQKRTKMKLLVVFALVALVTSAPTSKESSEEIIVVNEEFYPSELKIYTADHDIVKLLFPINSLNFDDDDDEQKVLFFVEADTVDGVKQYKGLSIFNNGNVTKLLPTGTCVDADNDDAKTAYFGATDGLYKYDNKKNTAEKFGTITDSIIDIAKVNGTDLIYILTDKNELFKVTEEGTKKEKMDSVVDAKQIVLDFSNNLYYYAADKKPYVIVDGTTKNIEGLPLEATFVELIKPPFVIDDGVPFIVDNKAYIIYANGTSELSDFQIDVKPSASSMEAAIIQYFAHDKSIYEYNILVLMLGGLVEEMKTYLEGMKNDIEEIATRHRDDFKP